MPRYLVERTFPNSLDIPMNEEGAGVCLNVVDNNIQDGVTWIQSEVSGDRARRAVLSMARR